MNKLCDILCNLIDATLFCICLELIHHVVMQIFDAEQANLYVEPALQASVCVSAIARTAANLHLLPAHIRATVSAAGLRSVNASVNTILVEAKQALSLIAYIAAKSVVESTVGRESAKIDGACARASTLIDQGDISVDSSGGDVSSWICGDSYQSDVFRYLFCALDGAYRILLAVHGRGCAAGSPSISADPIAGEERLSAEDELLRGQVEQVRVAAAGCSSSCPPGTLHPWLSHLLTLLSEV